MSQQTTKYVVGISLLFVLFGAVIVFNSRLVDLPKTQSQKQPVERSKSTSTSDSDIGRRLCPDEWFENKMPQFVKEPNDGASVSDQYFIIDGERRELEEFDLGWIKENCEVNQPEVIY